MQPQNASVIDISVIVGGGVRRPEQAERNFLSGADIILVGNAFENNPHWSSLWPRRCMKQGRSRLVYSHLRMTRAIETWGSDTSFIDMHVIFRRIPGAIAICVFCKNPEMIISDFGIIDNK